MLRSAFPYHPQPPRTRGQSPRLSRLNIKLTIRQLLGGTELSSAQFDTIRLRLLKVGARVRQTSRRWTSHGLVDTPNG